ncbi:MULTISPECIES: hypothetical protein [unclassified Geodermatophilus]|uniref:hypothetical protein n=1 Tax=unclassified Geodermatophilus TaxID=2637632 RepID=UPI003EEA797C
MPGPGSHCWWRYNAYCQDNELTWLDWGWLHEEDDRRALVEFTRRLLELRADEPVFRRRGFFQGRPLSGGTGEGHLLGQPRGS